MRKLAGEAHPKLHKAASLFKAVQAATEATLLQLASGRLPTRRRRKVHSHWVVLHWKKKHSILKRNCDNFIRN